MKTEKNILVAFLLNLFFAIIEFVGGSLTNSVAIVSDAIHDLGDSLSIGVSFFLEKISKKKPDDNYTYGYIRYSVLGGLITTVILLVGSIFVIYNAINRLINPVDINYDGMLFLAIFGLIINTLATYFTRDGDSINQKSVNLHMLEDVLGWVVVLIGAIIMLFTDIKIIDPLMSIGVALFILVNTLINFKNILDLFLEKTPQEIKIDEIKTYIMKIKGVNDVHHIHVWSIDGYNNFATMHVVVKKNDTQLKEQIKDELKEHGISHTTIEIENVSENCLDKDCVIESEHHSHHHH